MIKNKPPLSVIKPSAQQPISPNSDVRYTAMQEFVQSALQGQSFRIESLVSDASFRHYHRVWIDNSIDLEDNDTQSTAHKQNDTVNNLAIDSVCNSYMLMDAPPQLESIESFVRIDLLMATKVNVPSIIAKDIKNGFLLLQDFGDVEFATLLTDAKNAGDFDSIDDWYRLAINDLLSLQTISLDLAKYSFGLPDYDATLLRGEMALFIEWFLPYIDVVFSTDEMMIWQQFNDQLIENIEQQPKTVVHRDYHSRNIMLDQGYKQGHKPDDEQANNKTLGIIDFQDAVIGAYTYDLVSLVRDAYMEWSEEQVDQWINYFWQQLEQSKSDLPNLNQFKQQVNLMGLQRHLKILGIFVRLAQRDGKDRYLHNIPKVWQDLIIELNWLNKYGTPDIKAYIAPFYDLLIQQVLPQYRQAFADYF